MDSLTYPCMVISGLKLLDEVTFLKSHKCHQGKSLDLYLDFNNDIYPLGKADLELDYLLLLKLLSPGEPYTILIYLDKNTSKQIDLDNPESLINFIQLGGN